MSSQSERTFGSRITNAEALAAHLTTFTTYTTIRPEESVLNFKALITTVKTTNTLVATNQTVYSNAVENRLKLFVKNPDSLNKILAPIAAQVRAKYGKTSKEVKDLMTLIGSIRGRKIIKLKKADEADFVSQSHRSFGSQTLKFADIIAKLTQFGTDYAPTNVKIKLVTLNAQLTSLTAANNAVAVAYGQLKPAKDTRLVQFADLKERALRIKESLKSQFGIKSAEFQLVKGLAI